MHLLARVAKWQTRWLQVPVFERTWGFKSPLAHHFFDIRIMDKALRVAEQPKRIFGSPDGHTPIGEVFDLVF